jgi:hypothetical protein
MTSPLTCSASSRSANEQLFATATRADTWFLLEHPETYGEKALPESGLPEAVKQKLEDAAASVLNGRIQLIRRGWERSTGGRRFFVVVNHEEQPNLYEFRLDRVEDLLDLDLLAVAREDPAYRAYNRSEPLFLVCTNGKRDPCCSSLGLPLYREMRRTLGDAVLQTSHVGGHRFAPNIVALPSGSFYGYAQPEAAVQIAVAEREGQIHLPHFRGRSCYAGPIQAADAFLRRKTGHTDLLRYRLAESESVDEATWTCRFEDRTDGTIYCIRVRSEPAAVTVQKSCREDGPVPLSQFRLEQFEELGKIKW